jgi:hypothetical protein
MTRSQQKAKPFQIHAMILLLVFAGIYAFDAGRLWASPVWAGKTPKQIGYLIRTSLTESPVGRFEKRLSETSNKKSRNEITPGTLAVTAASGFIAFNSRNRSAIHLECSTSLISSSSLSDRAPPRI